MTCRVVEAGDARRRIGCRGQVFLLLAFVILFALACVLVGFLLRQVP